MASITSTANKVVCFRSLSSFVAKTPSFTNTCRGGGLWIFGRFLNKYKCINNMRKKCSKMISLDFLIIIQCIEAFYVVNKKNRRTCNFNNKQVLKRLVYKYYMLFTVNKTRKYSVNSICHDISKICVLTVLILRSQLTADVKCRVSIDLLEDGIRLT